MHNDLLTIGSFTIHGYGLMIAIGFISAIFFGSFNAKRRGLKPSPVIDIALVGVVVGFIGAKLLYVIVEFDNFLVNPLHVLGSGGFVVYGGLIFGVAAAMVYCHIKKLDFLEYLDSLIPAVPLAQGFGRIGCFLAGCCYGKETDSFIGMVFPADSLAPSGVKIYPTQLMSSIGDFLIMAILLILSAVLRKRKKEIKGLVGATYILLYGIGRFIIEFYRSDDRGEVGSLSTSQFISIFMVIGAIAAIVLFIKFGKRYDYEKIAVSAKNSAEVKEAEKPIIDENDKIVEAFTDNETIENSNIGENAANGSTLNSEGGNDDKGSSL